MAQHHGSKWVNKRDRAWDGVAGLSEGSRTCTCTHARVLALARSMRSAHDRRKNFYERVHESCLVYELEVREVVHRARARAARGTRRPWNPSYRFTLDSGPRPVRRHREDVVGRGDPCPRGSPEAPDHDFTSRHRHLFNQAAYV